MYRGSAKYTRVPTQEDSPRVSRGSAFSPSQFQLKEEAVPWKAVGLAALLFILGVVLLTAGCLIHTGHVENEVYGDRLWSLIILGALMFIPGAYHMNIAVKAFLGYQGYSFDQIPHVE